MSLESLTLIRHPETEASVSGLLVGRSHSPYSAAGDEEAQRISEWLLATRPAQVVVSPQARAISPVLEACRRSDAQLCVRVDPDIAEFDVGLAEGLAPEHAERRGLTSASAWDDPATVPYAEGESVGSFIGRCERALTRLLSSEGPDACAVSHRGVIAVMLVILLGLPLEDLWELRLRPARAARLEPGQGKWRLMAFDVLPDELDGASMPLNHEGDAG